MFLDRIITAITIDGACCLFIIAFITFIVTFVMLLTAKLFRSTSRSFKAFPSNRLGAENANTLISTETKSRNSKETESVCAEVTPSYPGKTFHQQLEVNTSNLKFRKSKKKESEQEVGSDVVAEECPKEEPALKKSSIEELSKLFLGESKSDFEQWLEGSCSIQTANKINSVHEIRNSCDHQDSLISSCNASDCSEEDKEDKARMTLVSEWNENKFCETSGTIAYDGEGKVDSRIQRSSYSSGCHSMTASSSSVVSDSEGASPSRSSPHQDVFTLQNELNLKMVDLPTPHITSANDLVFKLPEIESQFQVVQSKKKMKLKSRSGKMSSLDKSASISFNNLSIDKVVGDSKKQTKNHSVCTNGLGNNLQTEVVNLQPPISVNQPHLDVIPQVNTTESFAPKYISPSGVKPGIYSTTLRGDRLNVGKGVKKVKQSKKGQKIALTVSGNGADSHVTQNDVIPAEKLQSSADTEAANTLSKSSCSQKAEVLGRKSDDSHLTFKTDSLTRVESGVISFGLGCKDLDTFSSPLSMSVKCQHEPIERRKDNTASPTDRHVSKSSKQQFDLKQAQKFLMKAYDAVQKQRNEDSNSVFIYS